jgi:hypothetical protein
MITRLESVVVVLFAFGVLANPDALSINVVHRCDEAAGVIEAVELRDELAGVLIPDIELHRNVCNLSGDRPKSLLGIFEVQGCACANESSQSWQDNGHQVLRFDPIAELIGVAGEDYDCAKREHEQRQIDGSHLVPPGLLLFIRLRLQAEPRASTPERY